MKKLAIGLLTLALVTFFAGSALGAVDTAKFAEIKTITQQMHALKIQLIDKQAEAGLIGQEKASAMKQHAEQRQNKIEQELDNGQFKGFGKHQGHHADQQPATESTPPKPSAN
ncbi:MAG: YckD family protein [Peptococcaceae bacterium]|nr:YckD family protein [Peptococcaceae bacterium]